MKVGSDATGSRRANSITNSSLHYEAEKPKRVLVALDGDIPTKLIDLIGRETSVYSLGNDRLLRETDMPNAMGIDKEDKLRRLRESHPDFDGYLVVNTEPLDVRGWTCVSPAQFVAQLTRN